MATLVVAMLGCTKGCAGQAWHGLSLNGDILLCRGDGWRIMGVRLCIETPGCAMNDNPYQSPAAADLPISGEATQRDQQETPPGDLPLLARDLDLVVMHRRLELPAVCLKSGRPVEGKRLRKKVFWVSPTLLVILFLLTGPFLLLLILIVGRTGTREYITIPVEAKWLKKRRRVILTAWGGVLAAVGLPIAYLWISEAVGGEVLPSDIGIVVLLFSLVLALGSIIYGFVTSNLFSIKRIKGDYIWLNGAGYAYLKLLPHWPADAKVK